MISTAELIIDRPIDAHLHLRDDALLELVTPFSSRIFSRAVIMPNLTPPICSITAAKAYRQRIIVASHPDDQFDPMLTCYLTENLSPTELMHGFTEKVFIGAKLYPANATTNSQLGIHDLRIIYPLLEIMQKIEMPLLIHGELTDPDIDIFDREAFFIERQLIPLRRDFPALKIVLEHITTSEAVAYVTESDNNLAATVTPHHLRYNRNDLLTNGLHPHLYCLPILKAHSHQMALRRFVTSGFQRVFAGTDSAPHWQVKKESAQVAAGIFNAPSALAVYAEVFEEEHALANFEAFVSHNAANFYRWPISVAKLTLLREPTCYPQMIGTPSAAIIPFLAGQTTRWSIAKAIPK